MSLKPWRLLNTFCWRSLWGLRRLPVSCWFWFFRVLTCREHQTPLLFWPQPSVWAPANPFSFVLFFFPPLVICFRGCSPEWPCGSRAVYPFFLPLALLGSPPCFFLQSPQQNVMLWFFLFRFVLILILWFCFGFFFPFLLRVCPEKKSCACFLLFLHTSVYIPLTSLFSIVCARTDRFKRVSKKLF